MMSRRQWQVWALVALVVVVVLGVVAATAITRRRAASPSPLRTVAEIPLSGGTSRFDYQSLDLQRHLLFIAHLGASIVTVVDVRSNHVVADIPGISRVHGVLAVPELGRVYASATDDDEVAVIDEGTLRVVARVPTGDYPDGIAYDTQHGKLYVSDESGESDTVIDTHTNRRTGTIDLGGEAGNTQYDRVSGHILVDVQTRDQLATIDPGTDRIVARTPLPGCDHDHGLLIDTERRLAFVACDGNAKLLTMDLESMQVLSTSPVGSDPDVLAFDRDQRVLYVASESGVVSVFEERGRELSKLGEGFVAREAHSVAVDPDTHRVYLPLEDVGGRAVLRVSVLGSPPPAPSG